MIILRMNDLDDKITSFVYDLKAEGNIGGEGIKTFTSR